MYNYLSITTATILAKHDITRALSINRFFIPASFLVKPRFHLKIGSWGSYAERNDYLHTSGSCERFPQWKL